MAKTIVIALALILLTSVVLAGCGDTYIEAKFSSNPTSGQAPVEIRFNDQSFGDIDTWEWDFDNDGVVDSNLQNPQHTYSEAGNYTVSLTVKSSGNSNTEVKTSFVRVVATQCVADFTVETTRVDGIKEIQFTDQSTGNIIEWLWDFDANGIIDSKEQNPMYAYKKNGLYPVTLTVVTADCESTLTKPDYIRITGCPT